MSENIYNFGLTKEEEKRATELHYENIVIDMLFQGPIGTYSLSEEIEEETERLAVEACPDSMIDRVIYAQELIRRWFLDGKLKHIYKDCWYESGLTAGNRELTVSSKMELYSSAINLQEEFDKKSWLIKVKNASDIEYAHKNTLKAGIITCQETIGFEKDLDLIEQMYNFGLRVVQLTYNNHNYIGAGCMEENNAGLSTFGIKFVEKLNELGIAVDTGHCGKQTTLDACKYSRKPVIASHAAVEKVFFHSRAKSDEEILAIAKTGGVVGIFAMPWFIAQNPEDTTIEHFLDHIDYVVKLAAVDHVGIGTDWPMPQTKWMAVDFKKLIAVNMGFKPGDGPSTEFVKGMKDYRSFINITRGLMARGYKDEDIIKIIGGNWMRVFKEVWR
ncbi:dipeptidase [Clostridium sp.]|jgi:membrane dipeptidase|uniref:dipeptidase n=1 Tax=Clostridium sp. TaxID=1506 RepID=UPI003EEDCD24